MRLKILISVVIIVALTFTSMSFFSKSEPETPVYTIIKIYKGFEIREYKPILYASVTKEGKMMDVGSNWLVLFLAEIQNQRKLP